jgi:nitrilase
LLLFFKKEDFLPLDFPMHSIVIQAECGASKVDNIATMRRLIEEAARPGALVSLPEMWSCLGADRATKLDQSEALPTPGDPGQDGSAYRFLSDTARALGITLHGGSIGERVGDTLFNTTLVFGPDGRERARYRKIHLFDVTTPTGQGYRESSLFGAGDAVVTCRIDAPGGGITLGLTICYDLRFAELFLALRRAGAEAIMVPAAFTAETGRDHWEVLLRARAIETQCFILAAATTGAHRDAAGRTRLTYGHSLICDPWGSVLATAAEGDGFAAAELDMARLEQVRAGMPVLSHRRLV